jgi:phosphatidylethanolamine-binding protein (PEBP) family uncharacterized protein
MKKMIIAVLVGLMLIPAPMMARNDRGRREKPRMENRDRGGRKEMKVSKVRGGHSRGNRGGKVLVVERPSRTIVVNRPYRRPCPPPPPPVHRYEYCCYDSDVADVVGAVGAVVGIAALVSLIAQ